MKSKSGEYEVNQGEFALATPTSEPGVLGILFHGILNRLADSFVAGGIVKSRYEQGQTTLVLVNEQDQGIFEE